MRSDSFDNKRRGKLMTIITLNLVLQFSKCNLCTPGVSKIPSGSRQGQRYFYNKTKMLFFFFTIIMLTSGVKAMVDESVGHSGRIKAVTANCTGSYILYHHALAIKTKC